MTERPGGLILYYSRTGHTEQAVQALAAITNADVCAWDGPCYPGAIGILRGMFGVLFKSRPVPARRLPSLDHRPWVVIAGPIWAGQPAPPMRTLLTTCRTRPDLPVGLLLTCSDTEPSATIKACEAILGRGFTAQTSIRNEDDGTIEMAMRLEDMGEVLTARQALAQTS